MNKPVEQNVTKAIDSLQQRLTTYACGLEYADIPAETVHAAKVRIIDTLGALIGGFFSDPSRIARNLAAQIPDPSGATVFGTRMMTTPDMAAFVNATAARYVELNDTYHWPGSLKGHPSDVIMPIFSAAEHAGASGREFVTAVILGYEVYLRMSDATLMPGFDYTNLVCLGSAMAAGKLFGLSSEQMSHCISMAVVPNVVLNQVRNGHLSMFKAVAAGQSGRAGLFAAMLARAGMEGPHLPFEGKAGWCNHVSRMPIALDVMGGGTVAFKIATTLIKPRASCGTTLPSILAAEKVPLNRNIRDVRQVTVEVYNKAKEGNGTGEHQWNPTSRETADHSIPYVVAAALMDGTITPRSFDDSHLFNPELRALMNKIEVVENPEFTASYQKKPVHYQTRVTVTTNSGETHVGNLGNELSEKKSDAWIDEKFRGLSEDYLGAKRVAHILERLWRLDSIESVAEIPRLFVLA